MPNCRGSGCRGASSSHCPCTPGRVGAQRPLRVTLAVACLAIASLADEAFPAFEGLGQPVVDRLVEEAAVEDRRDLLDGERLGVHQRGRREPGSLLFHLPATDSSASSLRPSTLPLPATFMIPAGCTLGRARTRRRPTCRRASSTRRHDRDAVPLGVVDAGLARAVDDLDADLAGDHVLDHHPRARRAEPQLLALVGREGLGAEHFTKVTRCSTLPAGTPYCASAAKLGSVDGFWAR